MGKGRDDMTDEDRTWFQGQFDRLHNRMNEEQTVRQQGDMKNGSDIAHVREQMVRIELNDALIRKHEDTHHNPMKTWSIIGGVIAVATFLVEGAKMLFKSKGGSP